MPGYIVTISDDWNHRKDSVLALKLVWKNMPALVHNKDGDEREIVTRGFTVQIEKIKGSGWLTLPALPFGMIHESLHFIIAYFTNRQWLITLIPPITDLFYLPLAFVVLAWNHSLLGIVLCFLFQWNFVLHLMGNLQGDFYTVLTRKSIGPAQPQPSSSTTTKTETRTESDDTRASDIV